jgi:PmbA protein
MELGSAELVQEAVRLAIRAGADAADCIAIAQEEKAATISSDGFQRSFLKQTATLTLRLFAGSRGAVLRVDGSCEADLYNLVLASLSNLAWTLGDRFLGMAPASQLAGRGSARELGIFDQRLAGLQLSDVVNLAARAQGALVNGDAAKARMVETSFLVRARNVAFGSSTGYKSKFVDAIAHMNVAAVFFGASTKGGAHISADDRTSYGGGHIGWRNLVDIDPESAASTVLQQMEFGQRECPTGLYPVVFGPEASRTIIFILLQHCSGPVLARRGGTNPVHIGDRVASPLLTVVDEPLLPGGKRTSPFDAEGVAGTRKVVIENGFLREPLLNSYYGRVLDRPSTGNAVASPDPRYDVRHSNIIVSPGDLSHQDILEEAGTGLLVTTFRSASLPAGSVFTQAVSGFWIENGRTAYPVRSATITMPSRNLFEGIRAVGADPSSTGPIAAPTLMVDKVHINSLSTRR